MNYLSVKETLRLFVLVFVLPILVYACSEENDIPDPNPALVEKGTFVFNSGVEGGMSVDGSLSFVDDETGTVTNNLFLTVNGRSLGTTVQDGIILGDNLYIAVTGSNTIEVVNKYTMESVVQIKPDAQCGRPRDIVTDGKYVYASMQTGQVARINPATNAIDKVVEVGPNPEEMAVVGDILYVVNSDGLNWEAGYVNGKSVSKVNLTTMTEEKKIAVGLNPVKISADNSGNLLVLCMGDYGANPASIWKIESNDVAVDWEIPASIMAVDGNTLYTIDAPWGATEISYKAYSTVDGTLKKEKFISQSVDSPAGLAIHPDDGRIFITSYTLVDGYASYSTPGYVAEYTSSGEFVKKADVGVGAVQMLFLK